VCGVHPGERLIDLSALRGGEEGAIPQQHPALALETWVELLVDATHRVDRFRGMGNDVELIEGDLGMGQMLADPADEVRGHVDADRLDLERLAVMCTQICLESLDGGGILAHGDEDHAPPGLIGGPHRRRAAPTRFRWCRGGA